MDLIAFLRARLDEDEATAKAALLGGSGEWKTSPDGDVRDASRANFIDATVIPGDTPMTPAELAHIARHGPARVLREVAAKRAIVDAYERAVAASEPHDHFEDGLGCALEEIASVWSDHPDYRPERDWGA